MVAAVVLACAVTGCSGDDEPSGAMDQSAGATQSAGAPGTSGMAPGAQPTDQNTPGGDAPDDAPSTSGTTATGSDGATEGDGSEVIPQPQDTAPPRLDELYDDAPAAESLAQVPPNGSASGELVDGFPVGVIDLVPDATVTSSAVSAEGRRVQVSLEATAPLSPDEVIGHYRARFVAGGFAEDQVPAVVGTTAASFSRSGDALVVSSRTSGDETVFSVTGVLVAQG
ncbi:hypothetical protein E1262_07415 [Jiangella aurantiaca]|uniref:Uncharacterized protein n=1 Tax=Jiangella aurantiaca TaxID=2530373 RepID=A0A4R5AEJ7_9ACTN|nr:hypothetical protein [Jiangella aurantiaca]TDD70953.1 hypothetical protein E1262_07415 [Jiangella aurantiaca]